VPNKLYPPPSSLYRRLRSEAGYWRDRLFTPKIGWQHVDERVNLTYVEEPLPEAIPDAEVVLVTTWEMVERVLTFPESKGRKVHLVQASAADVGVPKDRIEDLWRAPLRLVLISKWLYSLAEQRNCQDIVHVPIALDHSKYRILQPIAPRPKRVAMLFGRAFTKGSSDGIETLKIAKEKHPDMRAVLFGISSRPKTLPGWIEYRRNPPQACMVNDIYNGSSVYLCSSLGESFGLPAAEALACGCALVTTDCGGVRDYATEGQTALISPPQNPGLLAENLIRVLGDEGLRMRLAEEGGRRIREFSWDRSTTLLEQAIGV
jgi:glycosyltransferase involved in cell wall biosynthesis